MAKEYKSIEEIAAMSERHAAFDSVAMLEDAMANSNHKEIRAQILKSQEDEILEIMAELRAALNDSMLDATKLNTDFALEISAFRRERNDHTIDVNTIVRDVQSELAQAFAAERDALTKKYQEDLQELHNKYRAGVEKSRELQKSSLSNTQKNYDVIERELRETHEKKLREILDLRGKISLSYEKQVKVLEQLRKINN